MPCSRRAHARKPSNPQGSSCACTSSTGRGGKASAKFASWYSGHRGTGRFVRRHLSGTSRKESVMSGVRVLVGTRKGAFILTGDGKRKQWNVSGPHFAGWEIYHMKGSPADPNRLYASQTSGWFGQIIQRSCDGGRTWETPGGGMTKGPDGMPAGESNKFVYDASPETGKPLTTHQLEADQPGPGLAVHPRPEGRNRPLRAPHRAAPLAPQRAVHAEALGRDAVGRRRRLVAGGERQPAHRLRVRDRRARPRAGDHLRRPHQERLRALRAGRQAARVPQPKGGQRVGTAHEGIAATGLLPVRAARCHGRRLARAVRGVFRHDRRAGVRPRRHGRQLGAHPARPACRAVGRGPDAAMIRVVLPPHLRALAQVKGEGQLDVPGRGTRGAVLDALEARYPMLRGPVRGHVTERRAPFLRFFACARDLTHEPPDAALPDAVASGAEPFLVIGAIAGG